MPTWGWIALLIVLAVIVAPMKLRILKKMFKSDKDDSHADHSHDRRG